MHSTSRRLQPCNGVAGSSAGASDWSDVDDARTVDRNYVPVRDDAECRAHHLVVVAPAAIFFCRIFIGEESGADSKLEWQARHGL